MSFGENLGVVTVLSKGGCLAFKCSALYGSLHFSFIVSQDMCSLQQRKTVLQALYWYLLLSSILGERDGLQGELLEGHRVHPFSQIFESTFLNQVMLNSCAPKGIALVKRRITCRDAIKRFLGWLVRMILWISGLGWGPIHCSLWCTAAFVRNLQKNFLLNFSSENSYSSLELFLGF